MADLIKRPESQPGSAFGEFSRPQPPISDGMDRFLDLGYFYLLLRKRKWLILAVMITVAVGFAVEVYTTTSLYTAVATVQIDPESSNTLPFEDLFSPSLYFLATENYVRTQAEVLQSQSLSRRVVNLLKLNEDPVFNQPVNAGVFSGMLGKTIASVQYLLPGRSGGDSDASTETEDLELSVERTAMALRGGIGVNPIRGTRLLEISYTAADPSLAAKLANQLVDEFIQWNLEKFGDQPVSR